MRTKDIVADGGTSYAFASNYDWKTNRLGRKAKRVVVTATGRNRKAWNGYTFHDVTDGVEISFVGDDGRPTGVTDVVRPAEIRQLWSEYKAHADEVAEYRHQQAVKALAEQERAKARLDAIFALIPNAKRPVWADYSISVKLSATELSELLEVAYAAGVNSGRRQYRRELAGGASS